MAWAPDVQETDGCWSWAGGKTTAGYGQFRGVYVHRASYEAYVGPIPDGHQIDHLCRNRACYNPRHLEAVTQAENILRAAAAKSHCPKGHPHSGPPVPGRKRRCAVCHRERERERQRRHGAEINARRRERRRAAA